ncbi:P63C domain-containing protein [Clostridium intestinale]|uniref:P63C domain-containing protein n=1 Tax=Clostridium intestinale TaxID=36845 RepID=UPI002DD66BAA|nr:P63C domain-containing protein [Clostridium intestinale]WRY53393.1 P63C domain-containing protein [Clostridium intestinale]
MKTPKVIKSGVLEIFNDLPCYVLDNGQRVFRLSNLTKALRDKEHGKFGNYLASSNIVKYLPDRLKPLTDKNHDRTPQGVLEFEFDGKMEKGYSSEDFMDVCSAFITANLNNEKLSEAQQEMVKNANKFVLATAKIGIIALIDEATGYQAERNSKELQLKMKYFLVGDDKAKEWEKTFPDELWYEFGRLTNWKGSLKKRPKYWGKYVNQLIYNLLDEDIAKYLRENKPPKYNSHKKYFQWLNDEYGLKELTQHIWQIIGMAKLCEDMKELKLLASSKFNTEIDI